MDKKWPKTWPQISQSTETSLESGPYKVAPIKHLACIGVAFKWDPDFNSDTSIF